MKWNKLRANGFKPYRILKIFLPVAIILMVAMVLGSDYNRHPDEINHFLAANYYANHFLPPVIGDPAVVESYSAYGVSYLNYHWIEYFCAGKFIFIVSPIINNPLVAARLSAVFLFCCLAFYFLYRAEKNVEEFIIPCLLIITPQIWYVFSYINNDAFALFISIIITYQLAIPKSSVNKFLQAEDFSKQLLGGVLLGILLGIMLICKANYWTFIVFVGLWILFNFAINLRNLKKYVFVLSIAILILSFRCGLDFYVNGETNFVGISYFNYFSGDFEKKQGKLMAYQEQMADKCCKQSTIENDLSNSHPDMKLKAKGFGIKHLFTVLKWHEFTFASFVGGYGYMNIWASFNYYRAIALLYIAFGLYLVFALIISKNKSSLIQLTIVFFAAFLTVFVSFYLSWTYAFQPQGRYLFPIIGMLALLIYSNRQYLHNIVVNAFIICAFSLSVYSFVFVGLVNINSK